MTRPHRIDEMDLLALADGMLDAEPARKSEIEARIATAPGEAARLADYRAQTDALRAAYGAKLAEPVPERLRAVLEGDRRARPVPFVKIAASAMLAITAGLGGWQLGRSNDDGAEQAMLDASFRQFVSHRPGEGVEAAAGAQPARGQRALGWFEDEMAIRLHAPDLSGEDFALVDKRALPRGDERLVQLDYAAPDGRSFSLFLAPRWQERPGAIAETEREGVTLAYWNNGPLATSIATHLSRGEARDIAEAVRAAMRDDAATPPATLEPEYRAPAEAERGILADSLDLHRDRGGAAPAADISAPIKPN